MGGRANGQAYADGEQGPPSALAEISLHKLQQMGLVQINVIIIISVQSLYSFPASSSIPIYYFYYTKKEENSKENISYTIFNYFVFKQSDQ